MKVIRYNSYSVIFVAFWIGITNPQATSSVMMNPPSTGYYAGLKPDLDISATLFVGSLIFFTAWAKVGLSFSTLPGGLPT